MPRPRPRPGRPVTPLQEWNPATFLVSVVLTLSIGALTIWVSFLFDLTAEKMSDPVVNFEVFTEEFGANYALFAEKGIDWSNITSLYRPLINSSVSEKTLFSYFCKMLQPLDDPDTFLLTKSREAGVLYRQCISGREGILNLYAKNATAADAVSSDKL